MISTARRRILVVEDEPLVRLTAVDALADRGFDVIEADNAEDGIQAIQADAELHLLFTDVNMPGAMTGIDLAEHLLKSRPNLKVIITSALPPLRKVALLNAHFLAKPYGLTELCRVAIALTPS